MATTKQMLARLTSDIAGTLGDYIQEKAIARESVGLESDKTGQKQPTVGDILKDYNDKNKLLIAQEKEAERIKYGMTPLEYQRYESSIQGTRSKSATALSARFKKEEEDRKDKEAIVQQEEKFQQEEKEGKGYLPSLIRGQFPSGESTYANASDINVVFDTEDAPDRDKVDAYFTLDDVDFMLKNNEFEKAGITRERVIQDLNINKENGLSIISVNDRQKVQQLLFDFLNTSYGSGMRNALKMKYKEKQTPTVYVVPERLEDFYNFNNNMEATAKDSVRR
jgi:hypothetical protein